MRKAEQERKRLLAEQKRLEVQLAKAKEEEERLKAEKEAEAKQAEEKALELAKLKEEPAPAEKQEKSIKPKKMSFSDLKSILSLTDKQVKQLYPIMKEKSAKQKAVIRKYAGKGESARGALINELTLYRKYYDKMFSHILSEEQFKQYMTLRQQQKASRQ